MLSGVTVYAAFRTLITTVAAVVPARFLMLEFDGFKTSVRKRAKRQVERSEARAGALA